MSTPSPGAVVSAFISAVERNDLDAAAALLHADVRYENVPVDPVVGRDATLATMRGFLGAATEVRWPVLRQHEAAAAGGGGVVWNERLDRFRIGDGWLELPVAGVFEVDAAGLITLWRDYFDLGTYMRRLGELTGG